MGANENAERRKNGRSLRNGYLSEEAKLLKKLNCKLKIVKSSLACMHAFILQFSF